MTRGLTSAISVSSHGRHARDLAGVRLLVNAPLAARLPLEMLDDVGDVDRARDRCPRRRARGRAACRRARRTDGRSRSSSIARLLADEHQLGLARALRRTPSACRVFHRSQRAAVLAPRATVERLATGVGAVGGIERLRAVGSGRRSLRHLRLQRAATATLRRRPCTFVRFIALPRSAAASSSSLAPRQRQQIDARPRPRAAATPDRPRRGADRVPRTDFLADVAAVDVRADAARDARRESRRDARSSDTKCSASSRARRARRAPASDTPRGTACTCRTDRATARRPRAAGCR